MEKPLAVLKKAVKNLVIVKLKNGKEYKGRLESVDDYMNLILSKAMELEGDEPAKNYGSAFIRGNNIVYIILDASEIVVGKG